MESAPNKQKKTLRIAIIVAAVLALAAVIIALIPRKDTMSEIIASKTKPSVSKEPIEWDRDSMMRAFAKCGNNNNSNCNQVETKSENY